MADPAQRRATYADLEAVPPEFTAEIVAGELVVSSRGLPPLHAMALAQLGSLLSVATGRKGKRGDWIFLNRPEIHAAGDVLVPSLAAWERDRFVDSENWAELAPPDLVCEMSNPGT